MFIKSILNDIDNGVFHFNYLVAVIVAILWFRMLLMLELNSYFGPMIQTIGAMLRDLIKFFWLGVIQLTAFSSIGMLCFPELTVYKSFHSTLMLFLRCGLGNFDFTIYDELGIGTNKYYFGMTFHTVVVLMQLLIIVNLLIAIMSDTYGVLNGSRIGLYQ